MEGEQSPAQEVEGLPPFVHIRQNDFWGRKHKKLKEEDISICECKYDPSNPESACGESCLNLLTSTECTSGYCPCGEHCRNQKFQKCEYAKTKLFKTEGRGWGLLADQHIKAGEFIIEYCGEVISSEVAKRRSHVYEAQGLKDAYIISLNSNYFIDATKKGSLARFINHSWWDPRSTAGLELIHSLQSQDFEACAAESITVKDSSSYDAVREAVEGTVARTPLLPNEQKRLVKHACKEVRRRYPSAETLPKYTVLDLDLEVLVQQSHVYAADYEYDYDYPRMIPAADSALEMLEKCEVGSVNEAEKCCCICLEDLGGGEAAVRMPCKHVYHGGCIKEWLRTSHYCPLCHYEMPTE